MTRMELEQAKKLTFAQLQEELGRLTRPDGKKVSRPTVYRCIEAGLPAHRLTDRSPYYFFTDEVRAFVGNRWNRRTPDGTSASDRVA